MKFYSRPYHLLLLSSVVFLFLCIFLQRRTIDLPLEDSYFIMDRPFLFGGFSMFLFVSWVVHRVPDQLLLSRYITWFYAIVTIGCMALVGTFPSWGHTRPEGAVGVPVLPANYVNYIPYIITAFLIAQALLFVNVLVGMVTKLKRAPKNATREYYVNEFWKQYRPQQQQQQQR
jgi:hypothetical protein